MWAIQPEAISAYEPIIRALHKNPTADVGHLLPKHQDFYYKSINAGASIAYPKKDRDGNVVGFGDVPKGTVAMIPLSGVVMKNDYCGDMGTSTIGNLVNMADAHPNIIGSVFITDTPGGAVDGTPVLGNTISGAKKPIVGYVDGLCCSAGYWAISGTDHIMAAHQLNTIGSIGVMCAFKDYSKMEESEGIVTHTIYATNSTDKNKDYTDATKGDYSLIQKRLDQMNDMFKSTIQKNRWGAGVSKDVFTGKTYLAEEAKSKGLIDSIGTLSDAIKLVNQLSKS